jgi:transglutaminase-like putative cysteine protease
MEGVDSSAIPSDHRQRVAPSGDDSTGKKFELAVRREDLASLEGKKEPLRISAEYLASDVTIQSDHKEIVAQAEKIVSPEDTDLTKVRKLVDWTAKNIKREMKDSFTALSVLRDGEGECESHAKLYTALARSRKIPTRMVMGLVYAEKAGFLYHAWAESYVNGWIAVDPTSGHVPADATHIKIGTGDYFDELDSMMKLLGKVKIEVLDFK